MIVNIKISKYHDLLSLQAKDHDNILYDIFISYHYIFISYLLSMQAEDHVEYGSCTMNTGGTSSSFCLHDIGNVCKKKKKRTWR